VSKEATGQMGAKIGSSEYWSVVNKNTLFGSLMGARTDYQATIGQLGTKAAAAIEEVYEDLSDLGAKIRYLPSSDRNALAKQVEGLYDICKMSGVSVWHKSECVHGLNLSIMSPWGSSFRDERGIEKAIEFIERSRFSGDAGMKLLQEAARWSISFAAGGDKEKQEFLETAAQGNLSSRFLQDVAAEYQNRHTIQRYEGRCGYPVGSKAYMTHLESKVFSAGLPILICAASGNPDYEKLIKDALNSVANQLSRDLDTAIRENDYITDETADKLKAVVSELDHCGVSTGALNSKIEKLAWFVGGDPAQIRRFQRGLNALGYGESLTEDGVYGPKTQNAWLQFIRELENGTVPTLRWVDILQSEKTSVGIGATKAGETAGLQNAFVHNKTNRYIRIDPPHPGQTGGFRGVVRPIDYNHINFGDVENSNRVYEWIQKRYNHYPLDDRAYNALKDLPTAGKKVRIAGKVLLVAGVALDVLELGLAVNADLKDADKKLGKTTVSTAVSIGSAWAGAALFAKGGMAIGAATGPAAPIVTPILTLVGGVVGAISFSRLGKYVVDISHVED